MGAWRPESTSSICNGHEDLISSHTLSKARGCFAADLRHEAGLQAEETVAIVCPKPHQLDNVLRRLWRDILVESEFYVTPFRLENNPVVAECRLRVLFCGERAGREAENELQCKRETKGIHVRDELVSQSRNRFRRFPVRLSASVAAGGTRRIQSSAWLALTCPWSSGTLSVTMP